MVSDFLRKVKDKIEFIFIKYLLQWFKKSKFGLIFTVDSNNMDFAHCKLYLKNEEKWLKL